MDSNCSDNHSVSENDIPIAIGSRIKSNEDFGTVRYIGELPGRTGTWYGVEWDDPSSRGQGENNGTIDNVQYFEVSKPGAGSFIRRDDIAPLRTFVEAMRLRYTDSIMETEMNRINSKQSYIKRCQTERLKAIDQRLRGTHGPNLDLMECPQKSLEQLFADMESSWLDTMNIARAGNVSSLCPALEYVTLSRNLITGWQEVVAIAAQLPQLCTLNLDDNRLALDIDSGQLALVAQHFHKLEKLSLQRCGYTWSEVLALSVMWPTIDHLKLGANRITHITPTSASMLQTLTILNLNDNPISSWQQVVHLGRLPNLRILCLKRCRITEIRFQHTTSEDGMFNNLKHLILSHNLISDWPSICELSALRIHTLVFEDNPLVANEERHSWEKLIFAMIPSLKHVNYTLYSWESEREEAERHYLRTYTAQWQGDATLARQQQLLHKYGIEGDVAGEREEAGAGAGARQREQV